MMTTTTDTNASARPDGPTGEVERRTGSRALLQGGSLLALGMLAANGGNYALNLLLGRWLTPAEFADATLMVTLMLVVTAIAVALQLLAARSAGIHQARGTDERADATAAWLQRAASQVGLLLMVAIAAPAAIWAEIFHTGSAWPFVILAVGMPAYLVQAVGRGLLQGRLAFGRLAATFLLEMVVRVVIALVLVALGLGVEGATIGLTASFLATWWLVRTLQPVTARPDLTATELGDLRISATPVLVLLLGQIVVNNGDVMVVKSAFPGGEAGVYAAIALIGRAVFFLSWSAVTTLFPAAAQRHEADRDATGLLLGGVAVVAGACAAMTVTAALFGERFFTGMFGPEYAGVNSLLVGYAIATSMFSVANLIVTHQLTAGRRRESGVLVAGAMFQTALLLLFHDTLAAVVRDQLIAMGVLLAAVAATTAHALRSSPIPSPIPSTIPSPIPSPIPSTEATTS